LPEMPAKVCQCFLPRVAVPRHCRPIDYAGCPWNWFQA
jgi:hypothetical protein